MSVFLQLVKFQVACALIYYHPIALGCLDYVIVYDSDALLVPNTAFEDNLCFSLSSWQANFTSHILFMGLHVRYCDA